MRGIYTPVTDIRRKVFTEVARMSYEVNDMKELDYLIDTRNPGGVWDITWSWFDLGEKYAKEFAISANWWMGVKAIDKVGFLKSFGRVDAL